MVPGTTLDSVELRICEMGCLAPHQCLTPYSITYNTECWRSLPSELLLFIE